MFSSTSARLGKPDKHVHVMRDEEGRRKEASKVTQTTRQSNTTHPRQSLFLENELPRVGFESTTLYTLDRQLYQLSH